MSVIIPTYNRAHILKKALEAMASQSLDKELYEIIVIDDASTDETKAVVAGISANTEARIEYIKLEKRSGASTARNRGILAAKGRICVFIDSDIVVNHSFLEAHLDAHTSFGEGKCIVTGVVINTNNFDDPTSEPYKLSDFSNASFATGNASVDRESLISVGMFDEDFREYGWEDLELGLRLRRSGLKVVRIKDAIGYHCKRAFELTMLPNVLRVEYERGRMALLYYRKQPCFRVRMTTGIFPVSFALDRIFFPFGWHKSKVFEKFLSRLEKRGRKGLLAFFVKLMGFHSYMEGIRSAYRSGI